MYFLGVRGLTRICITTEDVRRQIISWEVGEKFDLNHLEKFHHNREKCAVENELVKFIWNNSLTDEEIELS